MIEDCDYWVLCSEASDNKFKILAGMKMKKIPSVSNARKYSKKLGIECQWKPYWRFFNTKREAMDYFKGENTDV